MNGPKRVGLGRPSISLRNLADFRLSRAQTMVWLSCTVMSQDLSFSRSGFDDDLESAIDHALAVERHGVSVRLKTGISRDFLHALITHAARWPNYPREDDGFVVLSLHSHWE